MSIIHFIAKRSNRPNSNLQLNQAIEKETLPVSEVGEELIGAEVFDIDIEQAAGAAINGVAAHLVEVEVVVSKEAVVSHVDGAPHEAVLADSAPRHAHLLSSRQDFDGAEAGEDGGRDLLRELQPVAVASRRSSATVGLVGGIGHLRKGFG